MTHSCDCSVYISHCWKSLTVLNYNFEFITVTYTEEKAECLVLFLFLASVECPGTYPSGSGRTTPASFVQSVPTVLQYCTVWSSIIYSYVVYRFGIAHSLGILWVKLLRTSLCISCWEHKPCVLWGILVGVKFLVYRRHVYMLSYSRRGQTAFQICYRNLHS